jgi:hypothetical protein
VLKRKIQAVGGIKAQTVNPVPEHPLPHGMEKMRAHLGMIGVQPDQFVVSAPCLVVNGVPQRTPPVKRQMEPGSKTGIAALTQHILKGPEGTAHMVENRIQHHPYAAPSCLFRQMRQILSVSQSAVHHKIIDDVVSVAFRLENRSQQQHIGAEPLHMVQPGDTLSEPGNLPEIISGRGAETTQGIQVVKKRVMPRDHVCRLPVIRLSSACNSRENRRKA